MLIYKQRYKPRTTREFTKSDLTVYDSAGNTALNALTVYGKSEVVDGVIVSAGEGWSTVDLGSLSWTRSNAGTFTDDITNMKPATASAERIQGLICAKYEVSSAGTSWDNLENKHIQKVSQRFGVKDLDYTNASDFKSAMSGVILCYQLADPTQGNCVAIKTDDGFGINGTMATFTTGTPLRGIPETDIRDVMVWDGSAGTVAKVLSEIDLGTLNYTYVSETQRFQSTGIAQQVKIPTSGNDIPNWLCPNYTATSLNRLVGSDENNIMACGSTGTISIRNTNYTDASAFKTAMSGVMLVYELATPTTEQLTTAENTSISGLRTFEPQTHAQNNAQTDMTVDYTIRVPAI